MLQLSWMSDSRSRKWHYRSCDLDVMPILMMLAPRWLQPPDELTCVQRLVAIFRSLEHEQNWAIGVSVYLHERCRIHSHICSNVLLQAANISVKNWKHTSLGKSTHMPLRTIEEWMNLLTYLKSHLLNLWCWFIFFWIPWPQKRRF